MSPLGHSRHFDRAPLTSGLPRLADLRRVIRHVAKVPISEVGGPFPTLFSESLADASHDRVQISTSELLTVGFLIRINVVALLRAEDNFDQKTN
jgi:hypothetical protein